MNHDPRDIPILTDTVEHGPSPGFRDIQTLRVVMVEQMVNLLQPLLRRAAGDPRLMRDDPALFSDTVLAQIRDRLPAIVEQVLQDHLCKTRTPDPAVDRVDR